MENYQTHLISFSAVMVFESYEILFFLFCHSYLDLSHDFHAQLCFHSHFIFTAQTSLGCRMSDRQAFRSQVSPIAVMDPIYRRRVTAHVILKVREEDAVNDVLFAPLSNYRKGASQHDDRHIKQIDIAHQS